MTYLLALDQGTSSSRSIVFDGGGRVVSMSQRELTQIYPRPGWVEHDPLEIWRTQLATAREAMARAGLQASDISALGIANQRETTVLWNRRTGEPVHHAIVWQDRRAEPACAQLRAGGHGAMIRAKTGLLIDAYFSGTKLKWLLDEVPGAREQAQSGELAFGTVDSWLLWQLTGGALHATDVTNASRTMLFNVHDNQWDRELLALLDIPHALLPRVLPSSGNYGDTRADLLGGAIAIGGVAGDQQSALFGQACFSPGMAKNTYGTGCFMLMHTGGRFQTSANGLLTTSAAQLSSAREQPGDGPPLAGFGPLGGQRPAERRSVGVQLRPGDGPPLAGFGPLGGQRPAERRSAGVQLQPGDGPPLAGFGPLGGQRLAERRSVGVQYALEGSVFVGGAVVQWLRDGLHAIEASGQVQALAESVPDSGGVMMVPAFTGLGAPYWKPEARGTITGLTRGTTMAHIARAALESIAYQSAALLQAMSLDAVAAGGSPVHELRVDGGACVNDLLMQFQADLLGIPVVRPVITETTALGAAYLAGLASGVFGGTTELSAQWQAERIFLPRMGADEAAGLMQRWEDAVRRTTMLDSKS